MAKNPRWRRFWFSILFISALLMGLLAYIARSPSYEVARTSSPDSRYDAVLMEVPRDGNGAHSYWVCLQPPPRMPVTRATCTEVAYLSSVFATDASQPITLVWATPAQLEIRYDNATSIHMYKPALAQGRRRPPIVISTVHTGIDAR